MANSKRNFITGKMNKSLDERLVPDGQYIDALNVRLGSTEDSEIGSVENSKGNSLLTDITLGVYLNVSYPLSSNATCIGAFEDGVNETIYWFIHDSNSPSTSTGKADLIVSFNTKTSNLRYHVKSFKNSEDVTNTTLNFNPSYLISNVNKVGNLLFFTDNYNPPRRINVIESYSYPITITGNDEFNYNDILVIVKPPSAAPLVSNTLTGNVDTFMQDRFICFSYRYKYKNNEYSATSQFTNPSFVPKPFSVSSDTFLNEGMINSKNGATVTYDSGGSDVVAVEILFKESASNIIKVIESLDATILPNNSIQTYTFEDSKIFTILPEAEILRLYDNVPLLAKTQTLMGNRIMYGNYVDGFNLKRNGLKTNLSYYIESKQESFGLTPITTSDIVIQDYGLANGEESEGKVEVTLNEIEKLNRGGVLTLSFTITHEDWEPSAAGVTIPDGANPHTTVAFNYTLLQDFNSVFELVNSIDFQEKMGTTTNIKSVADASLGSTFTDIINNSLLSQIGDYTKFESGIDAVGPILVTASSNTSVLNLSVITMGYTTNISTPVPANTVYELFELTQIDFSYSEINNGASLHSNRGYEIGIVYMDEFNRATTALASDNNTLYIPCLNSVDKNSIKVTMPPSQLAPDFAKTFKFVIKPDGEDYETIYSQIYYQESGTSYTYFKLEGENISKVEDGDRYIVKRSADGPLNNCTYATVLEKVTVAEGDIIALEPNVTVPAGTYMKVSASDFSTEFIDNVVIDPGRQRGTSVNEGLPSKLFYDGFEESKTGNNYNNYTIPQGSIIEIDLDIYRNEDTSIFYSCDYKFFKLNRTYVASKGYDNLQDWFNGDNIASTFNQANISSGVYYFYSPINVSPSAGWEETVFSGPDNKKVNFAWSKDSATDELKFLIKGFNACDNKSGNARVSCRFKATLSDGTVVFETQPTEALPDVWYEGQDTYNVSTTGYHESTILKDTNQTSIVDGVFNLNFSNCFSFGNGVESYKIRDSIGGKKMLMGNRVTTISEQDYKRANRVSDITYSGTYNDETNLNRLNQFNLGLLNFKPLEDSFGPINKMFARETDILVLQEDKISYVLSGKNLLSDASGGNVLTSVPQVLGKQIARVEDFGISNNTESFVSYGTDKFFTDAKRGALLQLKGSSASNEQLNVISEYGMRGWFRDLFQDSFNTQKLGGYDPYMNEYVLSNNDILLPQKIESIPCGSSNTITLDTENSISYVINLSDDIGTVRTDFITTETVNITGTWNGVQQFSSVVVSNYSPTFLKNLIFPNELTITITKVNATDKPVISVTSICPTNNPLQVRAIVLTNNDEEGKSIHYGWNYIVGSEQTAESPRQVSNFIQNTLTPFASSYKIYDGIQGQGIIPFSGCDMSMRTFKSQSDTYDVQNTGDRLDRFRFLLSSTVYNNNATDLKTLINALPVPGGLPLGFNPSFNFDFNVGTISGVDKILYLIWDFRKANSTLLCYSSDITSAGLEAVCCSCSCSPSVSTTYKISNNGSSVIDVTTSGGSQEIFPNNFREVCSSTYPSYTPIGALSITIEIVTCDC